MRGAPIWCQTTRMPYGIIPADAGSTASLRSTSSPCQDHPRGCGEHRNDEYTSRLMEGSSPRMRGAPAPSLIPVRGERIIPADAGSTRRKSHSTRGFGDHPRGCGEHGGIDNFTSSRMGSSPRMRGALRRILLNQLYKGIIPADAGSTPSRQYPGATRKDHPRGCGEHEAASSDMSSEWGSSPRMRGAPHRFWERVDGRGIIPADAGSTYRDRVIQGDRGDHPRGCGEH